MPCYDPSCYEVDPYLQSRLDRATRVACELVKIIRAHWTKGTVIPVSNEALEWIKEHDRIDKEREERELAALQKQQLKISAIAKLSPKERQALGV